MTVAPIGSASVHLAILRPVLKKPEMVRMFVQQEVVKFNLNHMVFLRTRPKAAGEDGKDDEGDHRHGAIRVVQGAAGRKAH